MNDIEKIGLEGLRVQPGNLEETMGDLLYIGLVQPSGDLRDQLVEKVNCLNSMADILWRVLGIPETGIPGPMRNVQEK